MNRTPNTPANDGQILTDERIADLYRKAFNGMADRLRDAPEQVPPTVIAFGRAIEADLRASLAAPAIPTVDRNAPEGWKLVPDCSTGLMDNAGLAALPDDCMHSDAERCYLAMIAIAPQYEGAQPAAQVAVLTEDEQLALMVKVEDYMGAVDWAGTQIHAKCDAAEADIFAKVNEIILSRATPATVKTAEKK